MRLQGKVAVITGAALGIGLTTTQVMAREGAAVVLDYIEGEQARAEQAVGEIARDGGMALVVEADVSKQAEDIAFMAVFLASDDASSITGSTYFVDGGMLRQSGSL